MGRIKGWQANARKARRAKQEMIRTRAGSKGTPRAGVFAGAADASFLQPLDPDKASGRFSPPPKHFDPSSPLRKRKRGASLSPSPRAVPKSDASPSPLIPSSWPGLIRKYSLNSGKHAYYHCILVHANALARGAFVAMIFKTQLRRALRGSGTSNCLSLVSLLDLLSFCHLSVLRG